MSEADEVTALLDEVARMFAPLVTDSTMAGWHPSLTDSIRQVRERSAA
jgi:hypothetical protein